LLVDMDIDSASQLFVDRDSIKPIVGR
jgi:hypothetical protein